MIKVRASQIFTRTVDKAVAAKKDLDVGVSFVDAVEKYSDCPSKKNKGDLGWVTDLNLKSLLGEGLMPDHKGEVIGPIHSQYGYHILMITDIQMEKPSGTEGPFTLDTPMVRLRETFPEADSPLFANFRIGLPVAGYEPEATIESVCREHGKSGDQAVEVLNFLNSEYQKKTSFISPEDLQRKIQSGEAPVILDIREQWERDIVCLQGAKPVSRDNCAAILNDLDKTAEIVLVDWKGERVASFRQWLQGQGFGHVRSLRGGIDAWAAEIEPRLNRYEIDEDDGYRYEDITEEK
ncbi:MAG: peptidylprolyl isomerase [Nitrospinales bacterium]